MSVKSSSLTSKPIPFAIRITLSRVMPCSMYFRLLVSTTPSTTMKKWTLLHVATNPCGSSINDSSTPALLAWMHAAIQLSLLCEFHAGSCTSGAPRLTCVVIRRMPCTFGASAAGLCSAAMTIVGLPTVNVGFW